MAKRATPITAKTEENTTAISEVLTPSTNDSIKIKVVFKPTDEIQVGDEIQVKVDLNSPAHPEGTFQQMLWVKVTDPLPNKPEKVSMPEDEEKLGLPNYVLVFESAPDDQPEPVDCGSV